MQYLAMVILVMTMLEDLQDRCRQHSLALSQYHLRGWSVSFVESVKFAFAFAFALIYTSICIYVHIYVYVYILFNFTCAKLSILDWACAMDALC